MPANYHVLANIHDEIQMGSFANQMTGRLLDYAQRNDWLGRNITDLGCGTGESLLWLAQHSYIVTGVDESAKMLTIAQDKLSQNNLNVKLIQDNFQTIDSLSGQDMVLALNVLNELNNIRELQQTFQNIHKMLRSGKFFIFDMYTIEGLVNRNQDKHRLVYDEQGLTILIKNDFDYEKSVQSRQYTIFKEQVNGWQRQEAQSILRAYPVQGITALAQRSGFTIRHVLNMDMSEHKQGDSTARIIILAEKQ
ncbi:MAG: class I SAM-dependent methyltransferase [Phototrophicaceae bacterium]